jgi:serine/threonine protein kinase/Flp pilus assembly protein TadD
MSEGKRTPRTIFLEALENVAPEERQQFIEAACADDEALRERVFRLLAAHDKPGPFMAQPAAQRLVEQDDRKQAFDSPTFDLAIGSTASSDAAIGPYKILERIGEGGFGVVFMAEQTQPIRRRVALKIVKPGMDTRQVIARFEAERQALALMDHPHIAKVLDAGATETGRPYFVMELVKGIPITRYCDEQRLSTRQRLQLFIDVCGAIQHAHQKGIIHRDIKPTNVLVTLRDGKAIVKVIDFGVAKALGQQLTEKTVFTGFAQMIGTPLYMSPEQAALSAVDVDTRSDVYCLGVLLYELLTSTTPLNKEALSTVGYDELRRIIREDEPPRPSDRLSTLGAAARSTVSQQRQIDNRKLQHEMRGELDWIVMKALEKERDRRYESASALAADVECFLEDRPVQACPPSTWYRIQKFARPRKVVLTAAAIVAIAVIVGTSVSVWQAVVATNARKLADNRFTFANERLAKEKEARQDADTQRAQAAANLQRALDAVDQMLMRVGNESLSDVPHLEAVQRSILEDALAFYRSLLRTSPQDPAIRYRLAIALYRTSFLLGNGTKEQIEARDEASKLLIGLHEQFPKDAKYAYHLAAVEISRAWFAGAEMESHCRVAIKLLEPLVANPPPDLSLQDLLATNRPHRCAVVPLDADRADPQVAVVSMLRCQLADAYRSITNEPMLRRAIEIADLAPGWNQNLLAWCHSSLALVLSNNGRYTEAMAANERSLDFRRALLKIHPDVVAFRIWFVRENFRTGKLLREQGLLEQALSPFRDGWNESQKLVAEFPQDPEVQSERKEVRRELISCLRALNRTEEWNAVILGPVERSRVSAAVWVEVGSEYEKLEDFDGSRQAYLAAIEIDATNATVLLKLAETDLKSRQYDRAIQSVDRALAVDPQNEAARLIRGKCRLALHELDAAAEDLKNYLAVQPRDFEAYKDRALILFGLERYDQALADIVSAAELSSNDASLINFIGEVRIAACPDPEFKKRMLALADDIVGRTGSMSTAYVERGRLHAALGDYSAAQRDFTDRITALNATGGQGWHERYQLAMCGLGLHDRAAYQRTCHDMINRFRNSEPGRAIEFALWTSAITPNAVEDYAPLVELARRLRNRQGLERQQLQGLGAVLYRAGQLAEALEIFEQSEKAFCDPGTSKAYSSYFLAMTQEKLGQHTQAQKTLQEALAETTKELEDKSNPWYRHFVLKLLQEEATSLIEAGP